MSDGGRPSFNRRSVLKSSLAALAGGVVGRAIEAQEPAIRNVNLASSPSDLKITDMR
jgi:hypothetical protein